MLLFREKVPADWLPKVLSHLPEVLVDHAHLEPKAATSALNLEKYRDLFPRVEELNAIAIEHSAQMAQQRRLSHDGFQQRFDRTGSQLCVENVGWNFPHAEAQLDGWRASGGHHRNLLEPRVARMGIARARTFVTFFACS